MEKYVLDFLKGNNFTRYRNITKGLNTCNITCLVCFKGQFKITLYYLEYEWLCNADVVGGNIFFVYYLNFLMYFWDKY